MVFLGFKTTKVPFEDLAWVEIFFFSMYAYKMNILKLKNTLSLLH